MASWGQFGEEVHGGVPMMRPKYEAGQTVAEYALILAPLMIIMALSVSMALMLSQ
jgi:hypothetical protein